MLFSDNLSLLLLQLFAFLPCASVVILPKQCAATMPWDCGQRLKGLVQVSETPMQLDRFAHSPFFCNDLAQKNSPIGLASHFDVCLSSLTSITY
jgi:hypothetical protein